MPLNQRKNRFAFRPKIEEGQLEDRAVPSVSPSAHVAAIVSSLENMYNHRLAIRTDHTGQTGEPAPGEATKQGEHGEFIASLRSVLARRGTTLATNRLTASTLSEPTVQTGDPTVQTGEPTVQTGDPTIQSGVPIDQATRASDQALLQMLFQTNPIQQLTTQSTTSQLQSSPGALSAVLPTSVLTLNSGNSSNPIPASTAVVNTVDTGPINAVTAINKENQLNNALSVAPAATPVPTDLDQIQRTANGTAQLTNSIAPLLTGQTGDYTAANNLNANLGNNVTTFVTPTFGTYDISGIILPATSPVTSGVTGNLSPVQTGITIANGFNTGLVGLSVAPTPYTSLGLAPSIT